MENTQEQKTPEQWFQMLKEPYRSEAIKGIDKRVFRYTDYPNSLTEALMNCIFWSNNSSPTRKDWAAIYSSIKAGETTYLEPEPIELRPEDLVSGEVYTFILPKNDWKWTFKFKGLNLEKKHDQIEYYRLYVHHDKELIINSSCSHREKYYHATPEEKKLLLGEEETTDLEAKYNELKSNYELAKNEIEIEKDLRNQWHNHYFKLKEEYNELKTKYDQLEPKGEKVYFYMDDNIGIKCKELQKALDMAKNYTPIYEAVCIGKKKSVLVSENS